MNCEIRGERRERPRGGTGEEGSDGAEREMKRGYVMCRAVCREGQGICVMSETGNISSFAGIRYTIRDLAKKKKK